MDAQAVVHQSHLMSSNFEGYGIAIGSGLHDRACYVAVSDFVNNQASVQEFWR